MGTSFTSELETFAKAHEATRPRARKDKNTVAFLAVREDIKSALDLGYAVKTIWEFLHAQGRITYSYESFAKHVRLVIKGEKASPRKRTQKDKASGIPAAKDNMPSAFTFNVNPNLDELF